MCNVYCVDTTKYVNTVWVLRIAVRTRGSFDGASESRCVTVRSGLGPSSTAVLHCWNSHATRKLVRPIIYTIAVVRQYE